MANKGFTFGTKQFGGNGFGNNTATGSGESRTLKKFQDLTDPREKDVFADAYQEYKTQHPEDLNGEGANLYANDKLFTWQDQQKNAPLNKLMDGFKTFLGINGNTMPIGGVDMTGQKKFGIADLKTDDEKNLYADTFSDTYKRTKDQDQAQTDGMKAVLDRREVNRLYDESVSRLFGGNMDAYNGLTDEQRQELRDAWDNGGYGAMDDRWNGTLFKPGMRQQPQDPAKKEPTDPAFAAAMQERMEREQRERDDAATGAGARVQQIVAERTLEGLLADGTERDEQLTRDAQNTLNQLRAVNGDGNVMNQEAIGDVYRLIDQMREKPGFTFSGTGPKAGSEAERFLRTLEQAGGVDALEDEYTRREIGNVYDALSNPNSLRNYTDEDIARFTRMLEDEIADSAKYRELQANYDEGRTSMTPEQAMRRERDTWERNRENQAEKPVEGDTSSANIWRTIQAMEQYQQHVGTMAAGEQESLNEDRALLEAYMRGEASSASARNDVASIVNRWKNETNYLASQEQRDRMLQLPAGSVGYEQAREELSRMVADGRMDWRDLARVYWDAAQKKQEEAQQYGTDTDEGVRALKEAQALQEERDRLIDENTWSMDEIGAFNRNIGYGLMDAFSGGLEGAIGNAAMAGWNVAGLVGNAARSLAAGLAGLLYGEGAAQAAGNIYDNMVKGQITNPLMSLAQHQEQEASKLLGQSSYELGTTKPSIEKMLTDFGVEQGAADRLTDDIMTGAQDAAQNMGAMYPSMILTYLTMGGYAGATKEATGFIGKVSQALKRADTWPIIISEIGDATREAYDRHGDQMTDWDRGVSIFSGIVNGIIENYETKLGSGVQSVMTSGHFPGLGEFLASMVTETGEEFKQKFVGDAGADVADILSGRELTHGKVFTMDPEEKDALINAAEYLDIGKKTMLSTAFMNTGYGAINTYTQAVEHALNGTATPEEAEMAAQAAQVAMMEMEDERQTTSAETPTTEEQHDAFDEEASGEDRKADRPMGGTDARAEAELSSERQPASAREETNAQNQAETDVRAAELRLREAQAEATQAVMAANEQGAQAEDRARLEAEAREAVARREAAEAEYQRAQAAASAAVNNQNEQAADRQQEEQRAADALLEEAVRKETRLRNAQEALERAEAAAKQQGLQAKERKEAEKRAGIARRQVRRAQEEYNRAMKAVEDQDRQADERKAAEEAARNDITQRNELLQSELDQTNRNAQDVIADQNQQTADREQLEQEARAAELRLREAQTATAQAIMAANDQSAQAEERARLEAEAREAVARREEAEREYEEAKRKRDEAKAGRIAEEKVVQDEQDRENARRQAEGPGEPAAKQGEQPETVENQRRPEPVPKRDDNKEGALPETQTQEAEELSAQTIAQGPGEPAAKQGEQPETMENQHRPEPLPKRDDNKEGALPETQTQEAEKLTAQTIAQGPGEAVAKQGEQPETVENQHRPEPVPRQDETELPVTQTQEAEELTAETVEEQNGRDTATTEESENAGEVSRRFGFRHLQKGQRAQAGVNVRSWNGTEVTEAQAAQLKKVDWFARKHNVIAVVDSTVDGGIANGKYSPTDSQGRLVVHIAQDAENPLDTVFSHELYHLIAANNQKGAQQIDRAVAEFMARGGLDIENEVDALRTKYREIIEKHPEIRMPSDRVLREEVVANSIYDAIGDENTIRALAAQDRGLVEKIRDWVSRVMREIREMQNQYAERTPGAKALRDTAGAMEQIRLMIDQALEDINKLDQSKKTVRSLGQNGEMTKSYQERVDKAANRGELNEAANLLAWDMLDEMGEKVSTDMIRKLTNAAYTFAVTGGTMSEALQTYGLTPWGQNAEMNRAFAMLGKYAQDAMSEGQEAFAGIWDMTKGDAKKQTGSKEKIKKQSEPDRAIETVSRREGENADIVRRVSVGAKDSSGGELYSLKSMTHDRSIYEQMMRDSGTFSDQEIEDLMKTIQTAIETIEKNANILDLNERGGKEDRAFSPVKPNSDPLYKVSLDFSTLCRKRLLQQTIQEAIEKKFDVVMSKAERVALANALKQVQKEGKKIEIACALCYVESARLKSPEQIKRFMNDKRGFIIDYLSKNDKNYKNAIQQAADAKAAELGYGEGYSLREMPKKDADAIRAVKRRMYAEYTPTAEQEAMIREAETMDESMYKTAEGLAELKKNYPMVFDAYTTMVRNATKSKGLESDVPYYAGDTYDTISDALIAAMNAENGLRSQSWSDFQVTHLLDYIGAIIELSTRNAKMQAYTKVPEYARLMGKTGQMINLSLIPMDYDGKNLKYDPKEGMDYETAQKLRNEFPETIGNICIGIRDDHIRALLINDLIDYVIPYHKSSMDKATRNRIGLKNWSEYESQQNEKPRDYDTTIKDGDNYHKHLNFSDWYSYSEAKALADQYKKQGMTAFEASKAAMEDMAKKYIEMCHQRGLQEKFANFSSEKGYWKLLIDRKMINQVTGELIEQKAVRPVFDSNVIQDILKSEVSRVRETQPDMDYAVGKMIKMWENGSIQKAAKSKDVQSAIKAMEENFVKAYILESSENLEQQDSGVRLSIKNGQNDHNDDIRYSPKEGDAAPEMTQEEMAQRNQELEEQIEQLEKKVAGAEDVLRKMAEQRLELEERIGELKKSKATRQEVDNARKMLKAALENSENQLMQTLYFKEQRDNAVREQNRLRKMLGEQKSEWKAKIRKQEEGRVQHAKNMERLGKAYNKLTSLMEHPSKNKGWVPQEMAREVGELIRAVSEGRGMDAAQLGRRVQKALESDEHFRDAFADDLGFKKLYTETMQLLEDIGGRKGSKSLIHNAEEWEINAIVRTMEGLAHRIKNANTLFSVDRGAEITTSGERLIRQTEKTKRKTRGVIAAIRKYAELHLNGKTWTEIMSGHDENSVLYKMGEAAQESQRKMEKLRMDGEQLFVRLTQGKENAAKFRAYMNDMIETNITATDFEGKPVGSPMRINHDMLAALYQHWISPENKEAMRIPQTEIELAANGERYQIAVPDAELLKKGKVQEAVANSTRYVLTEEQMNDLFAKHLTEYDRQMSDAWDNTEETVWRNALNETSLELNGFEIAAVEKYFPITRDQNYIAKDFENEVSDNRLINMGSLKERVKSSKPVMLMPLTYAVEKQNRDVSRYAGMAVTVRDIKAIYNSVTPGYGTSVKEAIRKNWGLDAAKYLEDLIADMQGARQLPPSFMSKLRSAYASGVLSMNASVTGKQAASAVTAAGVVSWKSIGKALRTTKPANIEKLKEYSAGYYMRTSQGLADMEANVTTTGFLGRIKQSRLMKTIEAADQWTTRRMLWAAEYEIQDTTDLKEGTDEYWRAVAKKYDEILEVSQPTSGVMQKDAIARSTSEGVRMMTMFRTQISKNMNMIVNSVTRYSDMKAALRENPNSEEAKKAYTQARIKMAQTISGQVTSSVILAVMTMVGKALFHKMRDYEDDKGDLTAQSVAGQLLKDAGSSFASLIVGGSEVYDLIIGAAEGKQPFDIEAAGISTINDLYQNTYGLWTAASAIGDSSLSTEEKMNKLRPRLWKFAGSLSEMLGLPLNNARNLVDGIAANTKDMIAGKPLSFQESGFSLIGSAQGRETSNKAVAGYIARAMMDGNQAEAARLYNEQLRQGKTADALNSAIASWQKENIPQIRQAAEAIEAGNITEYNRLINELTGMGLSMTNAVKYVEAERKKGEKKSEEPGVKSPMSYEEIVDGMTKETKTSEQNAYTNGMMNSLLQDGNVEAAKAVRDDMLQNGKTASTINSSLSSYWKPMLQAAYQNGDMAEVRRITNMLVEMGMKRTTIAGWTNSAGSGSSSSSKSGFGSKGFGSGSFGSGGFGKKSSKKKSGFGSGSFGSGKFGK